MDKRNKVSSKSANGRDKRVKLTFDFSQHHALVKNGSIDISDSINASKYAVVSIKDDIQSVIEELQRVWSIKKPEMILSIVGGLDNFGLSNQIKTEFKNSLVKVAQCTNACIITDGINSGVSKLVGEVMERNYQDDVILIGINDISNIHRGKELYDNAQFGSYGKTPIVYKTTTRPDADHYLLDKNHNHFIFVDTEEQVDGYIQDSIEFRVNLERSFSDKDSDENIPTFLIVLNGEKNILKSIDMCVDREVPVLIIVDSKGCADLIVKAIHAFSKSSESFTINNLLHDLNKLGIVEQSEIDLTERRLIKIIQAFNKELISLFNFKKCLSIIDFEISIFRMFAKANQKHSYKCLELAMKWNLLEVAKHEIFTGDESFKKNDLNNLLEMALIEDRPNFVQLLIENDQMSLSEFLTYKRLYFLYNLPAKVSKPFKAPFVSCYKIKNSMLQQNSRLYFVFEDVKFFLKKFVCFIKFLPTDYYNEKDETGTEVGFNGHKESVLNNFMTHISTARYSFDIKICAELEDVLVKYPEINLYIWAILFNRVKIAKILLQHVEHQIAFSLLGKIILRFFSKKLDDPAEIEKSANEFENLACSILKLFDKNEPDELNDHILLNKIIYFDNLHTLDIAVNGKCKQFVASPSVQKMLDKLWNNGINSYADFITVDFHGLYANFRLFLSYSTFGILAPYLAYTHKHDKIINKKKRRSTNHQFDLMKMDIMTMIKRQQHSTRKYTPRLSTTIKIHPLVNETGSSDISYHEKYWNFILAPRSHFVYDTTLFVAFLLIFSYLMLCEFRFYKPQWGEIDFFTRNSSGNSSLRNHEVHKRAQADPHWLEYLIIYWVFTFCCQEFFQLFRVRKASLFVKIRNYSKDLWNYFDIVGCSLFFIGMIFRFVSYFHVSYTYFQVSRIILSIDLSIWFFRLLHVTLVFKSLGPKLVMIGKMIQDFLFFLLIMGIFICAYGISTQAVQYPASEFNLSLFKSIVDTAYWQIYGEITFPMHESDCHGSKCSSQESFIFVYIYTMFYFVIANILLLNLLIAMFSATVHGLQENTDIIWKYQYYILIMEYDKNESFPMPPPFNIFGYIILYLIKKFIYNKNTNLDYTKITGRLLIKERNYFISYLKSENEDMKEEKSIWKKENNQKMLRILRSLEGLPVANNRIISIEKKLANLSNDVEGLQTNIQLIKLNSKIDCLNSHMIEILNTLKEKNETN